MSPLIVHGGKTPAGASASARTGADTHMQKRESNLYGCVLSQGLRMVFNFLAAFAEPAKPAQDVRAGRGT